jgi:ubiquinone/menaquinone biosynthesis C-methylase UbiE
MNRAEAYDKISGKNLPLEWETKILKQSLKAKGKTLDIGCGTGRLLTQLSPEEYDLTGIDTDKGFIQAAKNKLKKQNAEANLVIADARKLPFKAETFDNVYSTGNVLGEVGMHAKDRRLMLDEMTSTTKPNGTIIVELVHRYWSFKDLLTWTWRYIATAWKKFGGLLAEYGDYTETYQMDSRHVKLTFHAFTTHEAQKLFQTQGLVTIIRKRGLFLHDWFFMVGSKTRR